MKTAWHARGVLRERGQSGWHGSAGPWTLVGSAWSGYGRWC